MTSNQSQIQNFEGESVPIRLRIWDFMRLHGCWKTLPTPNIFLDCIWNCLFGVCLHPPARVFWALGPNVQCTSGTRLFLSWAYTLICHDLPWCPCSRSDSSTSGWTPTRQISQTTFSKPWKKGEGISLNTCALGWYMWNLSSWPLWFSSALVCEH